MKRRVLSLVLTIVMLLGMLPTTALATEIEPVMTHIEDEISDVSPTEDDEPEDDEPVDEPADEPDEEETAEPDEEDDNEPEESEPAEDTAEDDTANEDADEDADSSSEDESANEETEDNAEEDETTAPDEGTSIADTGEDEEKTQEETSSVLELSNLEIVVSANKGTAPDTATSLITFASGTTTYETKILDYNDGAYIWIKAKADDGITVTAKTTTSGQAVTLTDDTWTCIYSTGYHWMAGTIIYNSLTAGTYNVVKISLTKDDQTAEYQVTIPKQVNLTESKLNWKTDLAEEVYCKPNVEETLTVEAEYVKRPLGDENAITYQWYSATTNATDNGTALTGKTEKSYQPDTSTLGTSYYYVVATCGNKTLTSKVSQVTVTNQSAPTSITIKCDYKHTLPNNWVNALGGVKYVATIGDSWTLTAYDENGNETPVAWPTSLSGGTLSSYYGSSTTYTVTGTSYSYVEVTSLFDNTIKSKNKIIVVEDYAIPNYNKNPVVTLATDGQSAKSINTMGGFDGYTLWTYQLSETNIATLTSDLESKKPRTIAFKALRPGSITVSFDLDLDGDGKGDGLTGNTTLTIQGISVEDAEGNLTKTTLELSSTNPHPTSQLTALSSTANDTFTWSSSDETVATVDTNGLVTAQGVGSVIISAKGETYTGGIKVVVSSADKPYFEQIDFKTSYSDLDTGSWSTAKFKAATLTYTGLELASATVSTLTLKNTTVYDTEKYTAVASYTDIEGNKKEISVESGKETKLENIPFDTNDITITLTDKTDSSKKTDYVFSLTRPRSSDKNIVQGTGIVFVPDGRNLLSDAYDGKTEGKIYLANADGTLAQYIGTRPTHYYYRAYAMDGLEAFSLTIKGNNAYSHLRISIDDGASWTELGQSGTSGQSSGKITFPASNGEENSVVKVQIQILDDKTYAENVKNNTDGFSTGTPNTYTIWVEQFPKPDVKCDIETAETDSGDWYPAFDKELTDYRIIVANGATAPVLTFTATDGTTVAVDSNTVTAGTNGKYTVTLTKEKQTVTVSAGEVSKSYTFGYSERSATSAADKVVDYLPVNSQYTNGSNNGYGVAPYRTLTGGDVLSLGNFGGYITFYLENGLTDDPKNAYGVDFYIDGNAFKDTSTGTGLGSMEPGQVWVSENGSTWYALAGSEHYEDSTLWDYAVTYTKTEGGSTSWTDNKGNTDANSHGRAFAWPSSTVYPWNSLIQQESFTLTGILIPCVDGTITGKDDFNSFSKGARFGYVDVMRNGTDNPYLDNENYQNTSSGFDLAWAVDANGEPVDVSGKTFHYVKVVTASNLVAGAANEKSTEVDELRRATPAASAVGVTTAPTGVTISSGEESKTISFEDGKQVYSLDLGDMQYVSILVNGTQQDDNIYINNQRVSSGTAATGIKISSTQKLVRIIVQNGEKEPVIYLLKLTSSGAAKILIDEVQIDVLGAGRLAETTDGVKYTATVGYRVDEIGISPKTADGVSVLINDKTVAESYALNEGENTFTIKATKGELSQTVTLSVVREEKPTSTGKITVSFTLMGDDIHGFDGTVHTLEANNLQTWIAEKTYEIDTPAAVVDLIDLALKDSKYTVINSGGNYISALEYDGKTLGEFSNGSNSGWMYTINGYHSQQGVAEQQLSDGDVIILHYTDDYTLENNEIPIDTPTFTTDLSTTKVKANLLGTVTTLKVVASVTDGGVLSYQWQSSTDKSTWTDITGATESTYTPDNKTTGTTYYQCIVTNTLGEKTATATSSIAEREVTAVCGANATYSWDESTKTLTISGTGDMANSTKMNAPWYPSITEIQNVVVKEGITSLGNYAFYYAKNLTSVTLPSSITKIMKYVFSNCQALQKITLPSGIKTIGMGAFEKCWSLESVEIPANVTDLTSKVFLDCKKLESVILPAGLKTIYITSAGTETFYECNALKTVYFRGDADAWEKVTGRNGASVSSAEIICNYGKEVAKVATHPEDSVFHVNENVTKGLSTTITKPANVTVSFAWYCSDTATGEGTLVTDGTSVSDDGLTSYCIPDVTASGVKYYYCKVTSTLSDGTSVNERSKTALVTVLKDAFTGSGTEIDPIQLSTADDMQNLYEYVAGGNSTEETYFVLTDNITLPTNWTPIGTANSRFAGTIDGKDFTLTVPKGGKPLFGYVQNATVKNLNIYGEQIEGYGLIDNFVGLNIASVTTLENITIKSGTSILKSGLLGTYITTENAWAGASATYTAEIRNCTVESGVVIGYDGTESKIGSIAGRFIGKIENCVSYATVKGVDCVGGLVGSMDNAMASCVITDSVFHGTVEATGEFAGGILGGGYEDNGLASAPSGLRPTIKACSVDGTVKGNEAVGGIWGGDHYVAQAWSANELTGNIFTGTITGKQYVGGVIGYLKSLNTWNKITSNFYSGAERGIGYVAYLDTSYENPTTFDDTLVFDTSKGTSQCPEVTWHTWKENLNRTDDPLGKDAENLCKKLNGESSGSAICYDLKVSGSYQTEYTVGDELDLSGIVITAYWTDKTEKTLTLSDVVVSGYDKTKDGQQTVVLTYGNITAEIIVMVKPVSQKITVSVSILGDSVHGKTDKPHGLAMGGLTEWVKVEDVEAKTDETVWDVLKRVFAANSITVVANDNNSYGTIYISSVTYQGVTLGEFSNGSASGWMFSVNEKHPDVSVAATYVKQGDEIVFHYTDDFNKEESGNDYNPPETPDETPDDTPNGSSVDYQTALAAVKSTLSAQASTSTPTVGSTGGEWLVLGLARAGVSDDYVEKYYQNVVTYVKANIDSNERLHSVKSTDNSRVILALTAIGKDVTNVGGHNLLKGLTSMSYLTTQGVNGPIWALIALDAGNYTIPAGGDVTRDTLIQKILEMQLSGGGWSHSGSTPDDMTPMAIQALAPYYNTNSSVKTAVDKAVTVMANAYSGWNNCESNAQVVVALSALGIDADTDSRFVKDDVSVLDAMLSYYLEAGSFQHFANTGTNQMATEQGFYALVAYDRFKNGQNRLYDMTDALEKKYTITVTTPTNGTVTVDKTSAALGDTVTVTVKAYTGYVLDTLKVNGTTKTPTDGKVTFTMPAEAVTIVATFKEQTIIKPSVTEDATDKSATTTVDGTTLENTANTADSTTDKTIVIAPTVSNDTKKLETKLPADKVSSIVNGNGSGTAGKEVAIEVQAPAGNVTIPHEILKDITKRATSGTEISLVVQEQDKTHVDTQKPNHGYDLDNAAIVEVTLTVDNQKKTDFGSHKLTVFIPVPESFVVGKTYDVVIISDDGSVDTRNNVTCEMVNGKKGVTIEVNHLSTFIVQDNTLSELKTAMSSLTVTDASKATYEKIQEIQTAYDKLSAAQKTSITTEYAAFTAKVTTFQTQLNTAIQTKVNALDTAFAALKQSDYSNSNWINVTTLYQNGRASLSTAKYQEQLDELYNAAWNGILSVAKGNDLTVTFRLIGDFSHDNGVTGHDSYVTWIPTTRYTLSAGATMYDLFTMALSQYGLSQRGADSNYVSSIQAPSVLGGYWLGEFDNGQNSGWMYTVNGTHPDVGLQYYTLHDGDTVIWHYVDDYTLEERSSASSPYYYRWLEAVDIAPESYMSNLVNKILTVGANGTVTPNRLTTSDIGKTITFHFQPHTGYQVKDVVVDGVSLGSLETYTYTNLRVSSRISVTFAKSSEETETVVSFKDVSSEDWFYEDVQFVVKQGLFDGVGNGEFAPKMNMTRAMLVTVLYRLEGEPAVSGKHSFPDVKEDEWYTDAVIWAEQKGIVGGYDTGLFGTEDDVTREQMATILYRYAAYKGYDVSDSNRLTKYTDADSIQSYARAAMEWANAVGLINGRSPDTLVPNDTAMRAEVAAVFHRFVENVMP